MQRYFQENTAGKWFCELALGEKTMDHSYFGDFRKRLGSDRLMKLFFQVRDSLKVMGLIREVFRFVGASQLVSQFATWDDRDKAIKMSLEQFNNETAVQLATDQQARFGCKGNNKYWFGHKEHVSVDMQNGLIHRVAVTSAEVMDAEGLLHFCPRGGAVFGDKGYCVDSAQRTLKRKGCHDAMIKKNNMKRKDRCKDGCFSVMRSLYERVFVHRNKRVRYRGLKKVQFQVGIRALVFNLKQVMALGIQKIELLPAYDKSVSSG